MTMGVAVGTREGVIVGVGVGVGGGVASGRVQATSSDAIKMRINRKREFFAILPL